MTRCFVKKCRDPDVLAVDVLERKIRCVLTARVNAPEPARSKTLTIWSGHCINYPSGIN